jgi:hypothetical protein
MITKPQIMPMLLEACPGFQTAWQRHLESWGGEEPGTYNDASEFAHYLVDSYEGGVTSEFPAAFATLETIFADGDQEARDVAGVGVLESLQNICSNHSCGSDVFIQWLGPLSRSAWAQIEKMWEGKHSLMDVIRAELADD